MSRAIRFTRAERDAVEAGAAMLVDNDKAHRALVSLLRKMDEASKPLAPSAADFTAVRAAHFVDLAREILGPLVFVPPAPTGQWWARIQSALTSQGIDAQGARVALEHVATWARNPQDPQSLARNAARYLHETQHPRDQPRTTVLPGRPPELRGRD